MNLGGMKRESSFREEEELLQEIWMKGKVVERLERHERIPLLIKMNKDGGQEVELWEVVILWSHSHSPVELLIAP